MRAHYADFQKSKEAYNHAHPQQKQPAGYMIHPGASQEKGWNRNEEEMYQVYGLEMAMKRFMHSLARFSGILTGNERDLQQKREIGRNIPV